MAGGFVPPGEDGVGVFRLGEGVAVGAGALELVAFGLLAAGSFFEPEGLHVLAKGGGVVGGEEARFVADDLGSVAAGAFDGGEEEGLEEVAAGVVAGVALELFEELEVGVVSREPKSSERTAGSSGW